MHRDYRVRLLVSSEHVYYTSANSPEEAETVAEQMFVEDEDDGEVVSEHIELSEARPVTQGMDGEYVDDPEDLY